MVWYGMVWYGMVWYSMVCYGMLWYCRVLCWLEYIRRDKMAGNRDSRTGAGLLTNIDHCGSNIICNTDQDRLKWQTRGGK